MSKPSKPTPPREPTRPTQQYAERGPCSITVHDYTLTEIMETIEKQIAGWSTKDRTMTRQPVVPTINDVSVSLDRGYGDDDCSVMARWPQVWNVTLSDAEYERLAAKHRTDMETYARKLAAYEVALTQYQDALARWENEKARAAESRERETLARLAAKYRPADQS